MISRTTLCINVTLLFTEYLCYFPVLSDQIYTTPISLSNITSQTKLCCPGVTEAKEKYVWPKPSEIVERENRRIRIKMAGNALRSSTIQEKSTLIWDSAIDMLPSSIRTAIHNLTLLEQITRQDLRLLDIDLIDKFQTELSRLLSDNQIFLIFDGFIQRQQYRKAAHILESFSNRFSKSRPEMIINLWNEQIMISYQRCNRDVQALLRQGLRLLPSPSSWNRTVIKAYGLRLISALPPDILVEIRDPDVAAFILDRWLPDDSFGCGFPLGPQSVDSVISIPRIQMKLLTTALGEDISRWPTSSLNRYFSLIYQMTPRLLALIDSKTLHSAIPFLSQMKGWNDGQGYAITRQLFSSESSTLMNASIDHFSALMDKLNYLAPYVLPDFFDSKEQNLTSIWAGKIENLSQRFNMAIPRLTAMALLRYLWPDYTQLTKLGFQNFSQQLDANYLKVAPWQLWKFNVNTLETSDVINKGLLQKLAIDRSAGSLTDGQIHRLSAMATKLFRKGDQWNMANTPAIYWSSIGFSDYLTVPVKDIQSVVDMISQTAEKMNGGQLGVIYTKLKNGQTDLSNVGFVQAVKALFPVPLLSQYSTTALASLAADMPADSIIRLLYAEDQLKKNISIDDLSQQPLLVAHLSPDRVNSFPSSATMDLLNAVSSSDQHLQTQTVYALHTRLNNFTRESRGNLEIDGDSHILNTIWFANIDIYPADLLATFSLEALQGTSPFKKIEILRSLGRLSLMDYYAIPKYKRVTILKQGLDALGKLSQNVEIDEKDLVLIGNAVVDLNGTLITKMTARAFESALSTLQGDVDIFDGFSARPCLTSEQRLGIRRALKYVYGYPSTWDLGTVVAACCSLDTLTMTELEAIQDVFIIEGCQVCNSETRPPFHLRALSEYFKTSCLFELGSLELEAGLYPGQQRVIKRRALAGINLRSEQTETVSEPAVHQEKKYENIDCEAVVTSGSGAGFTVNQLKSLSDDDIRDCLYELGTSPLSMDQATVLWDRILKVYGDASQIPNSQLKLLGWILPAIDEFSLLLVRLDDSDVLSAFGNIDYFLSIEKMKVLSDRVASEWLRGTNNYTSQELMILGRLLCGMNSSSILQIPSTSYLEASAYLGMILYEPGCSADVLAALATKAVENNIFGSPERWTASVVRNVGAVIGGLSPEQLRLLPPESFQGITPSAVMSIPINNFQALKVQQLRNFPLAAAKAVIGELRNVLVGEIENSLNFVIFNSDVNLESLGAYSTGSKGMIFVASLFLLPFYWHLN